jgi:Pvc16 N-terminal domain
MATYQAIATVGEAILGVLKDACPRPEFEGAFFQLYQPNDFQKSPPAQEGISLYLYRIATNTTRRNPPPRIEPDGRRFRAPLPLDLHYLLIPWAASAERQQWLLGWTMRALESTPTLSANILNHYGSGGEVFHPSEAVEVVFEALALQDIVNIWDAFKPNLQISASYVVRMVEIDSEVEIVEGRLVQTRVFDFGKGSGQ